MAKVSQTKKKVEPEEIMSCIFTMRPETNKSVAAPVTTFYTMIGLSKIKDGDGNSLIEGENKEQVFAKAIRTDDKTTFYVKCNHRNFYNPIDVMGERNRRQRLGEPSWTFVSVNPTTFAYYLSFLRNKTERSLRQAEKEHYG